jgi:DNA repair exonuclease SbcCD ATPase subunit
MVQLKCPVCGQEHIESKVEFCLNCSYLLTTYPPNLSQNYEVQEREKKRLQSAQEAWKKICHSYSEFKQKLEATNEENSLLKQQLETANEENSLLKQQLETANEENSLLKQQLQPANEENLLLKQQLQPANEDNQTSLVEQDLSNIATSNISTNVEYLPDVVTILQEIKQIVSLGFQSLSKTSLTETESENKVNKPDLSNESDNFNDNDEILNLVKNYNQQANFPDRIEVYETKHSKENRWNGGQEPAIFETNLTNRGEYWIINNQYLVPKPNQKINQYSYKTLSAFFECENYQENAADNMTLVKPAQVSLIDGEEKWQLETTGSLQF